MSIEKLSQTPAGTTDFTDLKKEVTKNAKGIAQITVSEYDTDASCVVKVGSVFENNGATFIVSGTDETPTGYAGIAVSTTFYLYFHYDSVTPANSEFQYSSTAPVWNDALQGWYNGNDRAFFSMYKDSTGLLYKYKTFLKSKSLERIGNLKTTDTMKWKYFYSGTNVTAATVYEALTSWVPSVRDGMAVYGHFKENGEVTMASIDTVWRLNTASIVLSYANSNGGTATITNTLTATGTQIYTSFQIMSNFEAI